MATAELTELPLLPSVPEEYFEIVDDEIREIEPMSAYAVFLANVLSEFLNDVARPAGRGWAVIETLFVLNRQPRLHRQPDVAFVAYDRWNGGPPIEQNAWDTIPNLAVEVVSPTNTGEEMERKVVDYLAAGVEQVWVLYTKTRRLYIHDSLKSVRVLTEHDTITLDALLPGFSITLATLFAEVERPHSQG